MDIKERLLALAIAIIFVFFIAYGFNTFYPEPSFDEYCAGIDYQVIIQDCPTWDAQEKGVIPPRPTGEDCWCSQNCSSGTCVKGECYQQNPDYRACQDSYNADQETHNKVIFISSLVIGLIVLVLGGVLISSSSVSIGLMGGGIFTIVYGTIRYWGRLEDVGRFLILGIVLAVLIWVGYRKFSPKKKRK